MASADTQHDHTKRTLTIGLVGGVGAGKSTVAGILEDLGCARFDADARAREALDDPEVRGQIVATWGEGVLGPSGEVDRAALGRIVFADSEARSRLESLIHPQVRESMHVAIKAARSEGWRAIVLDIPLLVEGGLEGLCDAVILVEARSQTRNRNVQSRGWDAAERARREASQAPMELKRSAASVVAPNDGSMADLRVAVGRALAEIEQQAIGNGGRTRST